MRKLSEQQKNEIRERYGNMDGSTTYASLAKEYGVGIKTIARIMNPQYYEREREANRKRMQNYRSNPQPNPQSTSKFYAPLHCHTEKDADIIEKLDSVENRNGYIKGLIRQDISQEKSEHSKNKG